MEINDSRNSRKNHENNCECSYCEYVNIQKSMRILPIRSISSESSKLPERESLTPKSQPHNYVVDTVILKQFYEFLWILRMIGGYPLSMKENPEDGLQLTFKWKSWVTFYSALIGISRIFISFYYYKDWGLYILGREYGTSFEDYNLLSLNVILQFQNSWEVIATWIVVKQMANLGNSLRDLETRFYHAFGSQFSYQCNTKKWRIVFLYLTVMPGIGLVTTLVLQLTYIDTQQDKIPYVIMTSILRVLASTLIAFISVVDEMRYVLMYFTLEEAFCNVAIGIRSQIKNRSHLNGNIVSKWTDILHTIRISVRQIGIAQAPNQIFVFLQSIAIFTEVCFITVCALMEMIFTTNFLITLIIGSMYIFRLAFKTIAADKIAEEEEKIVDLLLESDMDDLEMKEKVELMKIINMIQQKPSKISLSGYITIQKSLVPKMMNCIISYMVILIQLNLSYSFRDNTSRNVNDTYTASSP